MSNKTVPDKTPKRKKSSDRGLGRGLSALMSDIRPETQESGTQESGVSITPIVPSKGEEVAFEAIKEDVNLKDRRIQFVSIDKLERNPDQPRRHFDKNKLEELTESVKSKGVLQPILVRPLEKGPKNRFQIVAGERRWQAATAAGLTAMPVLIRELNDEEVLQVGVIENVQRADLNPIEEAKAYDALISQFYRKQEDVAEAVGKSRSYITNMLRLLKLPEKAQIMLSEGKISTGHARAIISAPDPLALADEISEKSLNVRQAEDWVRRIKTQGDKASGSKFYKDADTLAAEKKLADTLGLRVDLGHKGPGGTLKISYRTHDQLERLIKLLGAS